MDWDLRIALIVIGLAVIAFVIFDFNRRKKSAQQKQNLIKKMHEAASQVDSAGFDASGVGVARKKGEAIEPSFGDEPSLGDEPSFGNDESPLIENEIPTEVKQKNNNKENIAPVKKAKLETPKPLSTDSQMSFDELVEPEMVCTLILKAKDDHLFKGKDFMPLFLSQGLRHGDMGIFHRFVGQGGKPESLLYSLANAVKPGTFDIKNIEQFESPAFAFFMTLPGPNDPIAAYEGMYKTIKLLKEEMGGQILDESKSVYTEQTHQHQIELIKSYLAKRNLKS